MAKKKIALKASVPKLKQEITAIGGDELQWLRKMNLWLAGALALQAIAVVLFGGTRAVPVTVQYQAADQLASAVNGHQVLAAATRHLFDVRLTVVAALFLALLALASLVMATVSRAYYEAQLLRGSNLGRWLGFGLGAGFIMVALAAESGVSDLATLLLIVVLTGLGFGLEPLAERLKRAGTGGVLPHVICGASVLAVAAPWLLLVGGVVGSQLWDGHTPGSAYVMYATTLVLFACWALASHFRVRNQGKWSGVLYAEKMYMFLTLATGAVVAWQIFAGAL